jgi:hypothetical protein
MKKINESVIHRSIHFLFKKINKRSAQILTARFGLEGEKKSLSKIGEELGITRERVRQIESNALKQLKKIKKNEDFNLIIDNSIEIIKKHGDLARGVVLAEELKPKLNQAEENKLMLILNCSPKLAFNKATLKTHSFWSLKNGIGKQDIDKVNNFIIKQFKETKKSIKIKEVKKIIDNSEFVKKFEGETGKKKLTMYMFISKELKRNLIGEWGIRNWKSVSELGNREKAYLVLRKKGQPLHFREIADQINFYWKEKKSLAQTVHNELIKDQRFVLVGRGTYGLSEWGFKGGTVKDIIISFLTEMKNPLPVESIIEHVLEHKKVRKSTIVVNLSNNKYFNKDKEEKYFLINQ